MTIIRNGKDVPLNQLAGTVPNMNQTLGGWKQKIVIGVVTKTIVNSQSVETMAEVQFDGVVQPFTDRQLQQKPEGQRAWSWYWVHADPSLDLAVDGVIEYRGRQYRVDSKKNYTEYGYVEYHIVTDYTGAGPEVETP